jgi:enolase
VAIIRQLTAREILDSRGRPTVFATCRLDDGHFASASAPSGASTGNAEARELRDNDPQRYGGLGCRKAVARVNGELNAKITDREFNKQSDLDLTLCEIDGTPDKSRLGANAILAVSLAFARAQANSAQMPLWKQLATLVQGNPRRLPRLTINLFSGGRHAGEQVAIQDVLLVPAGAASIDDSLAMTFDVYRHAARLSLERYGMRLLRADEGGLSPPFRSSEEMIEGALQSIERAGYQVGKDFVLAIDVAASEFYSDGLYHLDQSTLDSDGMIERISHWVDHYPIVSVEDPLSEDDWANWPALNKAIGSRALVVGDDLLCTNPSRIRRAVELGATNALLLKVNQVGTLSEAAEAYALARAANWSVTISVRSGETEDDWAADLAVGWSGDQFKNGSITQSERLAKYNRLLEIEQDVHWPLVAWPAK